MQLFFTKNVIQGLIKLNIAKRTASQPPSTSHIHHLRLVLKYWHNQSPPLFCCVRQEAVL